MKRLLPAMWLFLCLDGILAAQTINYTYDPAGRLTGVVYPNGKSILYTYDPAGNLLRRQVLSTVADAASRPGRSRFASYRLVSFNFLDTFSAQRPAAVRRVGEGSWNPR